MNIDKAIEILTFFSTDPDAFYFPNLTEAIKLGIEALKRIQSARLQWTDSPLHLLPGETEE